MYDAFLIFVVVLAISIVAGSMAHDYLCNALNREDDDASDE
jgi:hypothetical protein